MNDSTANGDQRLDEGQVPPQRRSLLRRIVRLFALCYLGALAVLVLFENSLIYPAPEYDEKTWNTFREQVGAEEILIESTLGERVKAWLYSPGSAEAAQRFGLYFHGNGENLAFCSDVVRRLANRAQMTVLAVEYPGYDSNETSVSERGIYDNASAGLRWFCERFSIEPTDVVLIGRSLGGGVAMSLASETNSRAIVLLSTFTSMPDVAADKYPFFPVRWVMRNRYPSLERMLSCRQPLLQFHGEEDEIVPMLFGKRLFAASPAKLKRFVEFQGRGHSCACPDLFWKELKSFLDSLDTADVGEWP